MFRGEGRLCSAAPWRRFGSGVRSESGGKPPHSKATLLITILLVVACRPPQKMAEQPQYDPLEPSEFFENGMSARPAVEGTIARGQLVEDLFLTTGKTGNVYAASYPFEITPAVMKRGRDRYDIYCSMCHGRVGGGNGMIVQRGYRRPTTFHDPRLRTEQPGYFFDVITNGFGSMPAYGGMIAPADRWAIVAYLRALQLSQNASIDDVPESERWRVARRAAP